MTGQYSLRTDGVRLSTVALRVAAVAAALLVAYSRAAQAQTVTRWQGADMGRWNVAGNWTAGVPGATSTAILDNVNTAVVEFAGQAQDVAIGQNVSSRLIVWNTLTVGDKLSVGMSNQGYLSINSGGNVSAGSVVLGNYEDSSGSGNVQWLSQLTAGTLIVGGMGEGTFGASGGGKIISTTTLIGHMPDSTGSLSINYGGTWTNSGDATVGVSGTGTLDVYWASASIGGTLDIGANGTFNLENSTVSTRSFSNTKGGTFDFPYGTLTVDGGTFQDNSPTLVLDGDWWGYEPAVLELKNNVGSSFCKDLIVGDNYRGGSLTISGGTQFSSDNAYIARLSFGDQNSTVTVTGAGSTWNSNGSVYVGGSASAAGDTGSLTVTAGGHVGATGTLKVWNTGTVTLNGGSITTQSFDNGPGGTFNFYDGTLTVSGGTFENGATDLYVDGNTAGALPHLVLDNVTPSATYGSVYVGSGNPGQLTVSGGTDLTNTGQVQIGRYAAGTAAADGAGTTWNTGQQFIGVFGGGDGTLNVTNGAQVSGGSAGTIGYVVDATGAVTVDGTGSSWSLSSWLKVGGLGTGTMTLQNGGQVSNTSGYVGYAAGSTGTATVTGAGSTWTTSGSMYIGGDGSAAGGTGTVGVSNNAQVSVGGTLKLWNTGTLTLDGGSITTPSFDNSAAGLFNFYDGTLTVNGGSFHHGSTTLYVDGSTATAAPALVLNNATPAVTYTGMRIGNSRQGNLTLSGGTDLHGTGQPYIGFQSSAIGTVEVTGSGTTWTNDGNVFLGVHNTSQGALNISGGGQVTNAGGRMGYEPNTQGSVSVDGGGSAWNCTYLDVGENGTGYLSIGNGGTVSSSSNTWVGRYAGASGDVYLTGAGTNWTNSGSLYIGGDTAAVGGTGMVRLYNGAQLDVGGTLKVWDWDNGTLIIDGGTVTAHGFESAGGSFRFLDGTMTVGGGPLNFAARHLSISGMWTDEKPTFVLDGAVGSTCGELTVGTSYEGTMNIQNGATLTTMGDSLIGRFSGSKGTMTVTDAGTSWTTTGNLHLGGYSGGLGGLGTLNVNSGAVKVNNLLKVWDAGTTNLSGGTLSAATIDHTHGGAFNFTGGMLHVGTFQGNLVNQGGVICPGGSPGLTTVQGDLVMNAGLIEIELGGLLRGDLYDAIVVTGLLEVGGTLDVLLYDAGSGPFAPQLDNTFDILDWGSLSGTFGTVNLPTLATGLDWDTSGLYTTGDLRVAPEPATLSLLAMGGLALAARRVRNGHRG